jgi:aminopeptidase YwaD
VTITSASRTASAGEFATLALSFKASAFERVRFQTTTSFPTSISREAIGAPMAPSPRNASLAIAATPHSQWFVEIEAPPGTTATERFLESRTYRGPLPSWRSSLVAVKRTIAALVALVTMTSCVFVHSMYTLESGEQSSKTSQAAVVATSVKIEPFSKARAVDHVRALATDIGVRKRGTKRERRGANYVAEQFEEIGYEVRVGKFDVDGKKSRNVTAVWPDAIKYPLVIGAHIDSVPKSPGANDNASGTAVVLEVARLFAGTRQAQFVKFVGFGSEEYGTNGLHHVGSQVFVERLGKKGRAWTPGMISVDMIADGRPLIIGNAGIGPDFAATTLFRRLKKADFDVIYQTTCDCSDNGPFERAGIPAAFMWSGDEPNYHDPSDTLANLSKKDLLRTGRAVRRFMKSLDQALIKRFRKH